MPDTRYVEAQEHHRDLLDGLKPGDEVVITQNGQEVARLRPVLAPDDDRPYDPEEAKAAMLRMRERAKGLNIGKEEFWEIVREGKPRR